MVLVIRSLAGLSPNTLSRPNQIKMTPSEILSAGKLTLLRKAISFISKRLIGLISLNFIEEILHNLMVLGELELKRWKMWSGSPMSELVVIFDGKCELCNNSINWLRKKIDFKALDFHSADLSQFGLSVEQCSREVFVIAGAKQLSGAGAVAYLLRVRGNRSLSALITLSGAIGRSSYKWVAGNRNSVPVKLLSRLLKN